MNRLTDPAFQYHGAATHAGAQGLAAFRERMAQRQREADRIRRDREHAEERAYDMADEVIERAR